MTERKVSGDAPVKPEHDSSKKNRHDDFYFTVITRFAFLTVIIRRDRVIRIEAAPVKLHPAGEAIDDREKGAGRCPGQAGA